MTVRFQADVNLNQIILRAACRREPAFDFHSAEIAGLAGLSDPEVLARAAEENRVLVTHDLQTMPRHFAACITTRPSAGLLLIPQHLPLVYQFCDRCHIGYQCCTTCMHRRTCDTCRQQALYKAGRGGDLRQGGGSD